MYDKVSKNITVTINPTVLADDLVKMYKNATKFSAKFTDSTGKALVNSDVRFNINGVFTPELLMLMVWLVWLLI